MSFFFLGIHPLHHCKLWYFLSFGAYACIYPYLPLFYTSWGISPEQVGFINCLRPLVSFFVTPMWGAAADASGRHNAILVGKMLAQDTGTRSSRSCRTDLHHIRPRPHPGDLLVRQQHPRRQRHGPDVPPRGRGELQRVLGGTSYGDQRLWGAVAWGYVFAPLWARRSRTRLGASPPPRRSSPSPRSSPSAPAYPWSLDFTPAESDARNRDARDGASDGASAKYSEDDLASERERLLETELAEMSPRDVDGTSTATATIRSCDSEDVAKRSGSGVGVGLGSGAEKRPGGRDDPLGARADAPSEPSTSSSLSVASRVFAVVSRPGVALMFFIFLAMGVSMAVTDVFLFLWLDEQGASRLLMGLALCFTCLSEVVVFAKEKAIKRALSTRWSVSLILLCYALRQWFYAALPALANPWTVLPVQLLHGITFGLYWSVGNAFVHEIAPRGLNSAIMGVFGGCNSGGGFLGALGGGMLYRLGGGGFLFRGCRDDKRVSVRGHGGGEPRGGGAHEKKKDGRGGWMARDGGVLATRSPSRRWWVRSGLGDGYSRGEVGTYAATPDSAHARPF